MSRIVLMLAHEIEEYMQVQLLHELGHEAFSIGAYLRPSRPGQVDTLRPPLPEVPEHPDLVAAVEALGEGKPAGFDCQMEAKANLPDKVLDWADVIICHHLEHTWLVPQWHRIRGKRVIWRTVGQSTHGNEWMMKPLRRDGLQIVRYSPKERNIPEFAGEDALIRFWMDPDEWSGWTGEDAIVTNITQSLYRRSLEDDRSTLKPAPYQWTNWQFWEQATAGLDRLPAGPESEVIGGLGALSLPDMKALLRRARCYLYTGTQPASYTLGLLEAMMTGIPVVSIGPAWHGIWPYSPDLFEGHELAPLWSDRPSRAREYLEKMLRDHLFAQDISDLTRETALGLFAKDVVKAPVGGVPRMRLPWRKEQRKRLRLTCIGGPLATADIDWQWSPPLTIGVDDSGMYHYEGVRDGRYRYRWVAS